MKGKKCAVVASLIWVLISAFGTLRRMQAFSSLQCSKAHPNPSTCSSFRHAGGRTERHSEGRKTFKLNQMSWAEAFHKDGILSQSRAGIPLSSITVHLNSTLRIRKSVL